MKKVKEKKTKKSFLETSIVQMRLHKKAGGLGDG